MCRVENGGGLYIGQEEEWKEEREDERVVTSVYQAITKGGLYMSAGQENSVDT